MSLLQITHILEERKRARKELNRIMVTNVFLYMLMALVNACLLGLLGFYLQNMLFIKISSLINGIAVVFFLHRAQSKAKSLHKDRLDRLNKMI